MRVEETEKRSEMKDVIYVYEMSNQPVLVGNILYYKYEYYFMYNSEYRGVSIEGFEDREKIYEDVMKDFRKRLVDIEDRKDKYSWVSEEDLSKDFYLLGHTHGLLSTDKFYFTFKKLI